MSFLKLGVGFSGWIFDGGNGQNDIAQMNANNRTFRPRVILSKTASGLSSFGEGATPRGGCEPIQNREPLGDAGSINDFRWLTK